MQLNTQIVVQSNLKWNENAKLGGKTSGRSFDEDGTKL